MDAELVEFRLSDVLVEGTSATTSLFIGNRRASDLAQDVFIRAPQELQGVCRRSWFTDGVNVSTSQA